MLTGLLSASAEEYTLALKASALSGNTTSGTGKFTDAATSTQFDVTLNKSNAGTNNRYTDSDHLRVYTNAELTITAPEGMTMSKLVFKKYDSNFNTVTVNNTTYSVANDAITIDLGTTNAANSITIKSTGGQNRFAEVIITATSTAPDTRANVELTWSAETASATLGQDFTAPTLTADPEAALSEVKYESSKPEIASIDAEGNVTLGTKGGSTTITAAIEGSETYKNAKVEYILTVTDPNTKNYTLITSTDELYDGATGIIVYGTDSKALGSSAGNYRNVADVTISGNEITSVGDATIITFVKTTNGYNLVVQDASGSEKYLNGSSSSSTNLQEGTTAKTASISFNGNDAIITYSGATTRSIRYNPTQPRFAYYVTTNSGQKNVQLYIMPNASGKEVAGLSFESPSYTINEGGTFTAPTIENPNNIEGITYESNAPEVAAVDPVTGAVTIKGVGTAKITASSKETDKYLAGNASYTIVVKGAAATLAEFIERASEGITAVANKTVEGTVELVAKFPLTVTYVNGSNVFVTDGTSYGQIYQSNLGYNAGDVIPAGWSGKVSIYNLSTVEITSVSGNEVATETQEYKPVVVTDIDESMLNQLVMIYNMEFTAATATSGEITGLIGATEYNLYNSFKVASVDPGYYEVTGIVNKHGDQLQLQPTHFWAMPEKPVFTTEGTDLTEWPSELQEGMVLTWTVKYGTLSYVDNNQQPSQVAAYAAEANTAWNVSADGKTITYTVPADTKGINYSIINTVNGVKSEEAKLIVGEDGFVSGVQDVVIDNAPAVYYNLQGVRVEGDLTPGLYIRRQGNTTTKVIVR